MMQTLRPRLLVVSLSGLLIGCGARVAPVPVPPQPSSLPVVPFVSVPAPEVPIQVDPLAALIALVEAEFESGRAEYERGRMVAARTHFDAAVDLLLKQPEGARSEPRLRAHFDQLLDRIAAIEVMALRAGDGFTEAVSEPAAIDELLNSAMFEPPAPLATTAETVAADLARTPPGIPVPLNSKVLSYVELFQGRLREFMQAGLDRGQRYMPMIQNVFREEGVPLDLAYVPLVESAFKTNALSRASARGMWQFMLPTAQEHGLKQNWFLDERSDPEKATRAAAQYLKTLNQMFDGDWHFALASYNAGPGRLQRAVRTSKKTDYWEIIKSTRYLPRETREYVPMILAAIIIAKNPTLYGFEVASSAPLVYESVTVPGALPLTTIAEWAGIEVDELRDLNPDLRRTTTPMTPHELKVPVGTAATIENQLEGAESLFRTFKFHTVKRGETMTTVARRYGVTTRELGEANDLSTRARLRAQQTLMIPARSATSLPAGARPAVTTTAKATGGSPQVYRVRQGDTLFSIARQFDTTVNTIKQLNSLSSDRIKIGDRLTVRR